MNRVSFDTDPSRYVHWQLEVSGPIARLKLDVKTDRPFRAGYALKLNSYDLGVDIELADAIQRLRFEHPDVRVLVVTSMTDKIFCAGANIFMLASSSHPFKVNFCKFTNETRLGLEEFTRTTGAHSLAALNGTASGGGYELAIACDEIHLVDDGNSAVSLPEVPLLGVLPGTGGLTRLVDKRKVRRDLADVFSTLAEGCRGQKAVDWRLIDATHPKSRFAEKIEARVQELLKSAPKLARNGPGVKLSPLAVQASERGLRYKYVELALDADRRIAELTVHAPEGKQPSTAEEYLRAGDQSWALRAYRELDDALLQIRFALETVGLVALKTKGSAANVLAVDRDLVRAKDHWFVREILLHMARVMRRLDLTGRSFFALLEPGSCFAGNLFELALAADRSYMLNDRNAPVTVELSELNAGLLPMSHGLSRLECRFLGTPDQVQRVLAKREPLDADAALELGLVTFAPDDIDWQDEVRVALEERASLSPDALTGMEASLRFAGPESVDTKIFGRLSAWQNWIFTRPNATGPHGALTLYGKAERPTFDWKRT
jgi:benzoyl-CoA-dihydrodiol lyase